MTIDEVRRLVDQGAVVWCSNTRERGEAVRFLVDIGYELHPSAERWLEANPDNSQYLHPGLSETDDTKLTCFNGYCKKEPIEFLSIAKLIEQNDSPIDSRSDEEFLKAFTELMG